MKVINFFLINFALFLLITTSIMLAQADTIITSKIDSLLKYNENLEHRLDVLEKNIDDLMWYEKVGDVAFIDKVFMTGPPKWKELDTSAPGAGNPVKFWSYVFIPKDIDFNKKYPLIVFPHSGVHANFSTYYAHIVKELIAQQYIVVSAEYRGSTGYGKDHYKKIDYGGREIDDVDSSRKYMLDNYEFVDPERVGIVGWSHGGLISLMSIFKYPENYKVAFAGVPVSDLIRGWDIWKKITSNFILQITTLVKQLKRIRMNINEDSPVHNAYKLQIPLLIHTNTNDEDVNVIEVKMLIDTLKVLNKDFEYEIFQDLPGGHSFDRQDTKLALSIRLKIYKFLEKYLNPPKAFNSIENIREAVYR